MIGPLSLRQALALALTAAIILGLGLVLFAWQQRRAGAAAERPKTEAAADRAADEALHLCRKVGRVAGLGTFLDPRSRPCRPSVTPA